MTATSDTDIKEIKDLVIALDKKIDLQFTEIKGEIKRIDTRLDAWQPSIQKITDLAEKV